MLTDSLVSGTTLYVPSQATSTVAACIPGSAGWITYKVRYGDTLYSIATSHYITLQLIININCKQGTVIYPGDILWVPNVPTRTPYPSPLPGSSATLPPTKQLTETALPFTATYTPTNTGTPTPTRTATATKGTTQTPSATAIP